MRRLLLPVICLICAFALWIRPNSTNRVIADTAKTAQQAPALKLKVGDAAPDFTLRDQNGKDVSLHDYKGKKNVVLAFYVFAFSGG